MRFGYREYEYFNTDITTDTILITKISVKFDLS